MWSNEKGCLSFSRRLAVRPSNGKRKENATEEAEALRLL